MFIHCLYCGFVCLMHCLMTLGHLGPLGTRQCERCQDSAKLPIQMHAAGQRHWARVLWHKFGETVELDGKCRTPGNFNTRAVDVDTAFKVNLCTTGYHGKENELLKIHGTAEAPCRVGTKWKHSSRWLPPIYHASLRGPIDAQWPGRKQLVECRCEDNRCPFGHCTCNQRYLQWYLSQLLEVELNWIQVFCCFDLLDRQENPQSLPCASSKLNEFSKTYLKWMFFGSRHPLTATPPEGSTFFPVQDINFAPRQFQTVKFI